MIRMNSNLRCVSQVEDYVEKLVNKHKLSPDKHGNILISVTEAVTNAIRHGNCNDETKKVELEIEEKDDGLAFRVSDEGEGFDYRSLPDPTSPDHIMECGGRGVYLMRALCDEIRFQNNGSTVEMRFSIE